MADKEFEQCLGCGYKHVSSKPMKCVKCGAPMFVRHDKIETARAALRTFATEVTHLTDDERTEMLRVIRRMGSGLCESLATVLITKSVHAAIEKLSTNLAPR